MSEVVDPIEVYDKKHGRPGADHDINLPPEGMWGTHLNQVQELVPFINLIEVGKI